MRLPRESLLLLGLLTALCALGSVVAGIATGRLWVPVAPAASVTPAPTATSFAVVLTPTPVPPSVAASPSPVGAPRSLILIGVDDAQSLTPQLDSVLVLTFQPGVNNYYISAVPPSAEFQVASLSGIRTMRDIFVEDQHQQIGYYFMRDAVESRFTGFSIQADVMLDRDDFVGLVSSVGGLSWAGQLAQGPDLLNSYNALAAADSAGRMVFQQQAFEALFAALAQKGLSPNAILDYVRRLPQVQSDAARQAALEAFIMGAPALSDSTFIWRTYQPEMEIGSTP